MKDIVLIDSDWKGQGVDWHHDTELDTMVISDDRLGDDRFDHVTFGKYYSQNKLRPPEKLLSTIDWGEPEDTEDDITFYGFDPGDIAFIAGTTDMIAHKNPILFVLSEWQFYDLASDPNFDNISGCS